MVSLDEIRGLWRRDMIAWPDGRLDRATEVYWSQGPRLYADLRVPLGRPPQGRCGCLRDFDETMLRFMARQEGFFGHLDVNGSIGHWHRAFDYQPDTGAADHGSLAFEGAMLVERGIDLPYVEHWSREPQTDQAAMALWLTAEKALPFGCLVVTGDAFIYARSRSAPLPPATKLAQNIDNATSLQAAQDLFDCEISFGRRHRSDWRIERSSLCFREGAALSPVLDHAAGTLVIDDVSPTGMPMQRRWRIAACESTRGAPLEHWFGSAAPLACSDPSNLRPQRAP